MQDLIYIIILFLFILYILYPVQNCISKSREFCINYTSNNNKFKILEELSSNLEILIDYMTKNYPDDKITKNITTRLTNKTKITEMLNSEHVAFSKNKGEELSFCLKDNKVDMNTLMFIAIHELAHIATDEIGHTKLFWENFKTLLTHAVKKKIYTSIDYKRYPKTFCNEEIAHNPLYD